jgi:hypothetical protein|nr:MAG TPA: hypothetical protein [Caudoviricetes sp.]
MIVSNQSTKTEQNSPIKDVEIELVGNKSRVILHDNIAQEERETDDGNKYIAYTADEVSFYYDGKITAEDVRADFAAYWYFAEHGETKEERYNRLVAAFVREKYSQNAVEAIINNYLADPNNTEYVAEFTALQNFRKECKAKAKGDL